jgi:hypothetical protein
MAMRQYNKITGRIIFICATYGEVNDLSLISPLEYSVPVVNTTFLRLFSLRKMRVMIDEYENCITSIGNANQDIDKQTVLISEVCKIKKPVLEIANRIEEITEDYIPHNLIKILSHRTKKEKKISHALFKETTPFFSGWGRDDEAKMEIISYTTIEIYKQALDCLDVSNENQKRQFTEYIKKY